jgi:hypothetical protein
MTQSTIGIGTAANDGTGDTVRAAFNKCNLNFTDLYRLTVEAAKTPAINGSVTISGTDGTTITFPGVDATLSGLGVAQTWTAAQTFTNSDIKLLGSSTGATTFTSANAGASNYTLTFPAATATLAALGVAQTWTAVQTFTNSDIKLLGSSTGATTFTSANAGASNYTLTFPAVTDTVATLGTAQTFTAALQFDDVLTLGTATAALLAGAGASGARASLGSTAGNAIELYLDATHTTGDMRGIYTSLTFSGTGGAGEAMRAFGIINNKTVAAGGTVNGAHISLGTAGASAAVSGAANALRATFGIAALSTNIGGTCAVIQADTDIATEATIPPNFAFVRCTNTGAGKPSNLLRIPNAAAETDGLLCAHVGDAATHSIRFVSEDGTVYYLLATTTSTSRTES